MSKAHQTEEEAVEGRKPPFGHLWVLVLGAIVLVAMHGIVLHYVFAHAALPAAVVAGVIIVVVAKHLGLIGALSATLRRRSRSGRERCG